ncbi:MAG TPA: acetyl-CoA C-acyltransferase, partial [Kiloniellales bacterium]|nr:acetyl-CoA C-acyltransferase [Kiloniellales bacterium]
MQTPVLIAGYVRSPFHFAHKGELARVRPDELAAQVVRGLIERTGVDPAEIEDLIVGCAFPEGEQGLNVARLIGFLADLPLSVSGATVNRFCGSSMQSIHMAAGAIQLGAGEAFVCAGVESMSRVPIAGFNPLLHPGLAERFPQAYVSMGETAENVAARYGIDRRRQESLALDSHRKAAAARGDGRLAQEIVEIRHGNHV